MITVVSCLAFGAVAAAAIVIQAIRAHQRDSQPLSRLTDLDDSTVDPHWQDISKDIQAPDDLSRRRRHQRGNNE